MYCYCSVYVSIIICTFLFLNCWSLSLIPIAREVLDQNDDVIKSNILSFLDNVPKLIPTTIDSDIHDRLLEEYEANSNHEDKYLNITQLIKKYNYPVEEHQVTTEDGYILKLFRICGKGKVVFLMHGILVSAIDWVTPGPKHGLAFMLADQGYDVWMGNARGNFYSKRHVRLSPKSAKFWDFSWHEIGLYDLPATIDYTLKVTGHEKLIYIGHSLGTTTFFVLTSLRPEYNKKIIVMVALSAVAFMSHLKSPILRWLAPLNPVGEIVRRAIGYYEIAPRESLIIQLQMALCGTQITAKLICSNIVAILCGFDYEMLNMPRIPVIASHAPSGAATKQFLHYGQEIMSRQFRRYDYGERKNYVLYGTKEPPSYPVHKISAPVAIYWSENDWIANITDVLILKHQLQNVVEFYKIPYKKFSHADFLWAKDIRTLYWKKLSKLLNKFNC